MKLWLVELRGMKSSYGFSYVIAADPQLAYQKVKDYLNQKDIGFLDDRELDNVTLIAEDKEYPRCKIMLYL